MNYYHRNQIPMVDSGTNCDFDSHPDIELVGYLPVVVSGRDCSCTRSLKDVVVDVDNAIVLNYSSLLDVAVFGKDCWGCHLMKDGMIGCVAIANNSLTRSRCPSF